MNEKGRNDDYSVFTVYTYIQLGFHRAPNGSCTLLVIFKRMLHSIHCIELWTNQPPSGWYIVFQIWTHWKSSCPIVQSQKNGKTHTLALPPCCGKIFWLDNIYFTEIQSTKDCCGKMASLGFSIATTSSQSSSPHPHALAVRLTAKNDDDHVGGGKI